MADDTDDDLVFLFLPALVAVLAREESDMGRPLTRVEVESIRDRCNCVMSPRDVAETVRDKRGYDDIDPDNAWAEWQEIRRELGDIGSRKKSVETDTLRGKESTHVRQRRH